jgi:hypothetical protein
MISYTIKWQQPYSLTHITIDMLHILVETLLEKSSYAEARQVIDRIRSIK